MSSVSHRKLKSPASLVLGWAIAVCLFLVPMTLAAQTSQSGSLADIARQMRAQKQGQADATTAQQVADELSDDQNHNDDAPGGFKTFNAGDYTLWVPAPFKLTAHDGAGVVLEGPLVGNKQPVVLVGTPIALAPEADDDAFRAAAMQFSHQYAKRATCSKAAAGDRSAYKCSLAATDLGGTRVSGNAWLLRSSNNVYPVFCAALSESRNRDSMNNSAAVSKETASEAPDGEDPDMTKIGQKCEAVFQSIRPKEVKAQPATAQAAAVQPAAQPSQSPAPTAGTQANSTQANSTPANLAASTAPAGYKWQAFHYCSSPTQCWDASVQVPADAQLISSDCKQYVLESKVQGTSFLLMAGPAVGQCDGQGANGPNLVRWKQLADPENKRAPGTYNTVSTQATKLGGKPATITTIHFRNGLSDWMGRRAEVESNGVPLVVGCMAPRDHFDDGDTVCSALIGSLQMP